MCLSNLISTGVSRHTWCVKSLVKRHCDNRLSWSPSSTCFQEFPVLPVSTWFWILFRIAKIRTSLTITACKTHVQSLVTTLTTRLDHGNVIMYGISDRLLPWCKFQRPMSWCESGEATVDA